MAENHPSPENPSNPENPTNPKNPPSLVAIYAEDSIDPKLFLHKVKPHLVTIATKLAYNYINVIFRKARTTHHKTTTGK